MAKFLKSFFTSSEKKSPKTEVEEDKDFTPPLDDRRKLSISRSGRMKQNNKRRMKLNPELYGEDENHQTDRCPSKEYHVHGKQFTTNNNNLDGNTNLDNKSTELDNPSAKDSTIALSK